jgi:UDP-N-acetyl-2-amino-2-deoxyglucuronate dehydrogenase
MINVAIVGAGAISDSHIEAYSQFPERCKIVALVDIYPNKAKEKARLHNLDVDIYDDYQSLLTKSDLHLVSVCTPPYTHAPLSIDFLNNGKNVLVEKPMSSSLRECDEMIQASEKNNKILSVVAQNRYRTPMMKLKSILEKGMMGEIVHAQVDSFWWRGHSYYDLWWRGTWEKEGGGPTLNHAVHHIDALQWMIGMPLEVQAVMTNTSHDNAEVEDLSIAILRYDNNSLAQITSSVVHHGQNQQIIFQGKNARVSVPWEIKASKSQENGFPENDPELEERIQNLYEDLPEVTHQGHIGQIDDVLTSIEKEKNVLIDGYQGRNTLEIITAIYKSASIGEKVKLPLSLEDPFYTREGIISKAKYFYTKTKSVSDFSENVITTVSDE